MATDSIILPPFSTDTSNPISSLVAKTAKFASKPFLSKPINKQQERNTVNPRAKMSLTFDTCPPASLPVYYYTSAFPSLYATLCHQRSIYNNVNSSVAEPKQRYPRSNKIYSNLRGKESSNCFHEFFKSRSQSNTNDRKTITKLTQHSPNSKVSANDAINSSVTSFTCTNEKLKEMSIAKTPLKKIGASEETEACQKEHHEKQSQDALVKDKQSSEREEVTQTQTSEVVRGSKTLSPSSGGSNRSMSLSGSKGLRQQGDIYRQRRHSTVARASTSPGHRRRSRTATGMSYNEFARSPPKHRNDNDFSTTTGDNGQKKSDRKTGDLDAQTKKELNASFERYYATQVLQEKARSARKKTSPALPPQQQCNYWSHGHDHPDLQRPTEQAKIPVSKSRASKHSDKKFVSKHQKTPAENHMKTVKVRKSTEKRNDDVEEAVVGDGSLNVKKCSLTPKGTQTTQYNDFPVRDNAGLKKAHFGKASHQYVSTVIPLLTPEQLVIRDSVEKVRRWIKSLPKHFDAIPHVPPSTDDDRSD